ncbi:MAG: hypothetical protein CVU57_15015 [Deltaproteobacteria bacterium HGW-Deltaproteobacteria-15]|jgi:hypothetical protein|nr:MAG: hypothetical protein CVU57_15015 [Deltaproteobacteria bacterium HGW-Deltaproteobacteria-15]
MSWDRLLAENVCPKAISGECESKDRKAEKRESQYQEQDQLDSGSLIIASSLGCQVQNLTIDHLPTEIKRPGAFNVIDGISLRDHWSRGKRAMHFSPEPILRFG